MILGGTNFLIHYRVIKGDWGAVADNTEMKWWWLLIGAFVAIVLAERLIKTGALAGCGIRGPGFLERLEDNFRAVLFQVVAIITTTGFATRDIGSPFFGHAARMLFLIMMVIGGCVGSTAGGIKVLRIAIMAKLIRRETYRLRTPLRSIYAVEVPRQARSVGTAIKDITQERDFPAECLFMGIYREEEGEFLIPRGNYVIKEADTVFLVSKSQFIKQATDLLTRVK